MILPDGHRFSLRACHFMPHYTVMITGKHRLTYGVDEPAWPCASEQSRVRTVVDPSRARQCRQRTTGHNRCEGQGGHANILAHAGACVVNLFAWLLTHIIKRQSLRCLFVSLIIYSICL